MYTVFVGDKPIILTSHIEHEHHYKLFMLKTVNIGKVIKLLSTTDLEGVYLYHKNPDKLIGGFLKLLPNVVAGGGKVFNSQNEILFIYRNKVYWLLAIGLIQFGDGFFPLTDYRELR